MTSLLLDSHVVHWLSAEPERLSVAAATAIDLADELAVNDITWFELAWLARHGRINVGVPTSRWLAGLSENLRTVVTTPSIAETAVGLPASFSGDPADRLIYATAIEHGWRLVTKDDRLRNHRHPRQVALW